MYYFHTRTLSVTLNICASSRRPIVSFAINLNAISQQWNNIFFEFITLKSLGLHIQLGHNIGCTCDNPTPAFGDDFTVINSFGIHPVGLNYCGCETAQAKTTQLLRVSWFPATNLNPKTAATFNVLETFHLLSFESKCSGFEFYQSLARMTDNTATHRVAVSNRTLSSMMNAHANLSFSCSGPLHLLHVHGLGMATY